MRRYLRTRACIETVVEFGDHAIFDGVVTYPVIMVICLDLPGVNQTIQFHEFDAPPDGEFSLQFDVLSETFPQAELVRWQLAI